MKKLPLSLLRGKIILIIFMAVATIGAVAVARQADAAVTTLWAGVNSKYVVIDSQVVDADKYRPDCSRGYHKGFAYTGEGRAVYGEQHDCYVETSYGTVGIGTKYVRVGESGDVARSDLPSVVLPIAHSPRLLTAANNGSSFFRTLYAYEDVSKAFSYDRGGKRYSFQPSGQWRLDNPNQSGQPLNVNAFAVSANGNFAIVETSLGILRLDLRDHKLLMFAPGRPYGTGANPHYQLAISNDGRFAAVSNTLNGEYSKLVDLSSCVARSNPLEVAGGCRTRDLLGDVRPHQATVRHLQNMSFSSDGTTLSADVVVASGRQRIALVAPEAAASQLEYLALGDSFSSGEGDTANDIYYLPGTNGDADPRAVVNQNVDVGLEKCHVSLRSYPYLLKVKMKLNATQFKSVACSGAETAHVTNVLDASDRSFRGQYKQIKIPNGISNPEVRLRTVKNAALQSFIPSRAAQIEFLAKYKPRVATIGIGGNDIDFADIVSHCATSGSCSEASYDRVVVGKKIQALYPALIATYAEMKKASPLTKLYAVGYPQIFGKSGGCVGFEPLNSQERELSRQTITYLNQVIVRAAAASNIKYLDIENSFSGHELCSAAGSKAVNRVQLGDDIPIKGNTLRVIGAESFHPTAYGHKLMAKSIATQVSDLRTYSPCSGVMTSCSSELLTQVAMPGYFGSSDAPMPTRLTKMANLTSDVGGALKTVIVRPTTRAVSFALQRMSATKIISISLHSDPQGLGTVMTDEKGEAKVNITISEGTPAGYHTLHLYGERETGEQIDVYQPVLVVASDTDADGDGVPNTSDVCQFMPASGADVDLDGLDDACDAQVDPVPLYRVRNGNPARVTSATNVPSGSKEKKELIYMERNIAQAKVILGITSDYDPDRDGWALVGVTNNELTDGTVVNWWIGTNHHVIGMAPETLMREDGSLLPLPYASVTHPAIVPHASTRTTDRGCYQLTPVSLAVVKAPTSTDTQTRYLRVESTAAATCRKTAVTADMDNDGLPDNAQPIYRYRKGVASRGEDAASMYLERNVQAAEIHFGYSDYDADKNHWVLIAQSKSTATKGAPQGTLRFATYSTSTKKYTLQPLTAAPSKAMFPVIAAKRMVNSASTCVVVSPNSVAFRKKDEAVRPLVAIGELQSTLCK